MDKKILKNITVLYVEDEEEVRVNTSKILQLTVHTLYEATNGYEALQIFNQFPDDIDLVITDINMPKMSGLSLIEKIHESKPEIPCIITTAYNELEFLHRAINLGVTGFVLKPLDLYKLIDACIRAAAPIVLKKELIQKNEQLTKLNHELEEKVALRTQELEILANTDPLTGISNRRSFFNKAEKLLNQNSSEHIFAAMLDIDKFKTLNDTFGHAFGDIVLKKLTSYIQDSLNTEDIFGRMGGEEFAILSICNNQDEFMDKMEGMRKGIETIDFYHENTKVNVTISFGVAHKEDDESIDSLLARADDALYEAKDTGRNKIIFRSRV
ncbi:diguanylate cyclase [Arcobacter sp. FWKO B]|uniref:diguanylate cyclase n=1 Tax=Arcobacter sp. FWKO B TaxID=2593672 RepID=UPI0018A5AC28|nr:diguanylate cyclase [Arcobacter sp. FWKO B]QOG12312.1 diguanylate cyclase [Arcobacter sp. FWKO B]